MMAHKVGNYTYFVLLDKRTVGEIGYSQDEGRYIVTDASILSKHLTGDGIVDFDYQQAPYSQLWCVNDDGDIALLVRNEETKEKGISRITTDGDFESVAIPHGAPQVGDAGYIEHYYGIFNGLNTSSTISDDDEENWEDFDTGYGEFTYDFWANWQTLGGVFNDIFCIGGGHGRMWITYYNNTLELRHFSGVSSFWYNCPFTPVLNTWYHIAIVRSGDGLEGEWFFFINGIAQPVSKPGYLAWGWPTPSFGGSALLGKDTGTQNFWDGYLDNFRFSNIALWTSNFNPGTFPNNILDMTITENTKLLMKFEQNTDDTAERHTPSNNGNNITYGKPGAP